MRSEEFAIAHGFGKWGQRGVPKKGWRCIGFEDLGEPAMVCEMCERMHIRYAHDMEHAEYREILRVGCVCAGHMEEDLVRAKQRDAELRSRAGKRQRWLSRQWKVSTKGNDWIEFDGYHVVVYPKERGYGATVTWSDGSRTSRRFYASADEVKLAAFNVITEQIVRKRAPK